MRASNRPWAWLAVLAACDASTAKEPRDLAATPASAEPAPRGADPWASSSSTEPAAPDPWSATTPPPAPADAAVPAPNREPALAAPRASVGPPAGTYACQQLDFHIDRTPTYRVTGISFVLDGRGGYRTPNFAGGPGTISVDGDVLTFEGGAMNGWHGYVGTATSPFVRIRLKDPTAIATTLLRGDGMCYRQR